MHTKLSRFALAGVALVSSFLLPACDKTQSLVGPSQNSDPVVVSVRVDPSSVNVGATADVTAVVTDADGDKITCEWSSSSGGLFTGLSSDRCRSRWRPGSALGTVQLRVIARDARGGTASGAADVVVGDNATAGGPGTQPGPVADPPERGGKPGPRPDPEPTPQPDPTPTPDPSPSPSPSPSPGPGNRPPNVQITAAQGSCAAPCQIMVSAQGSDPDSDKITLHFSGCATGDFSGATATAVCNVPTASTFTATVTARDMLGASSQASVTVSGVASTNRPPTVTAVAEKQTCHPLPGRACEIVVRAQASDPDGDVLTYEWSGCATGRGTSATCSVAALADFTAAVVVRDTRGASASSGVAMRGVNTAPGGNPSAAVTGCHPYPNECGVDVTGNGTDPDGDALTYTWSGCANGPGATVKCLVPVLSTGTHTANVVISDGWTSVTRSVSVKGLNSPPTVSVSSSAPGCHPRPGAPCFLTVSAQASDPDGDPVSVEWSGCATGTRASTQCDVGEPGAHTATATVTDPFDAARSGSVTVNGTNRAPVTLASPSSGTGYVFPFRWEWADADGDIVHCVFDVPDPANCTYTGNCASAGGSANGSVACEARTRLGTDPPVHCAYGLQCYDGWTSTIGVFELN